MGQVVRGRILGEWNGELRCLLGVRFHRNDGSVYLDPGPHEGKRILQKLDDGSEVELQGARGPFNNMHWSVHGSGKVHATIGNVRADMGEAPPIAERKDAYHVFTAYPAMERSQVASAMRPTDYILPEDVLRFRSGGRPLIDLYLCPTVPEASCPELWTHPDGTIMSTVDSTHTAHAVFADDFHVRLLIRPEGATMRFKPYPEVVEHIRLKGLATGPRDDPET